MIMSVKRLIARKEMSFAYSLNAYFVKFLFVTLQNKQISKDESIAQGASV